MSHSNQKSDSVPEPVIHIESDYISLVFSDGVSFEETRTRTFLRRENPALYRRARKAAESKDYDQLFTLSTSLINDLSEIDKRFSVKADGSVIFDESPVNNWVVDKIKEAIVQGQSPVPWINFLRNTLANIHAITVEDIYQFLDKHESAPITEDGAILAYKKVDKDFNSFFRGTDGKTVSWAPGETVSLPREECDQDRNHTCSAGLHFCSRSYLKHFYGSSGRVVMVKIFPQDIVSIPVDYNQAKGRCCRAYVVREIPELEEFAFGRYYNNEGEEVNGFSEAEIEIADDIRDALQEYVENLSWNYTFEQTPYEFIKAVHEYFDVRGGNFVYDEEDVISVIDNGDIDDLELAFYSSGVLVRIH